MTGRVLPRLGVPGGVRNKSHKAAQATATVSTQTSGVCGPEVVRHPWNGREPAIRNQRGQLFEGPRRTDVVTAAMKCIDTSQSARPLQRSGR